MTQLLRKVVKKAFKACGFEIHRKGLIRTNMAEGIEHLKRLGFRPQTVIDAGVAIGAFELYNAFPDAVHLLIEPVKEFEEALKVIARKFRAEYVIAAAGAKPGTVSLNVHPVLFASSVFRESEGSHVDGVPREVLVVTIDDLCREKNLRGPYLIKADVHGSELQVLEGAKRVLEDTEIIILETHLFQFFIDGPQFFDIVNYMKYHGFYVYDIFGQHYRLLDGALGAVDLVSAKEDGQFRKCHYYATKHQCELLTEQFSDLLRDRLRKILV
jgi:FkbM family methyltransferase